MMFLAQAKGSAGEVRAQLYVALDQGYLDKSAFDHLNDLTIQIGRMLSGLMKYLQNSKFKGSKYK